MTTEKEDEYSDELPFSYEDVERNKYINYEAELVSHLISSGIMALSRADSMKMRGDYYLSFFGLSIGLERFGKLVLAADYANNNYGAFPDQSYLRHLGHNLIAIFDEVEGIMKNEQVKDELQRPRDAATNAITENLSKFAEAKLGRYANFLGMENPSCIENEPLSGWWTEVGEKILEQHYYKMDAEKSTKILATACKKGVGKIDTSAFTDECGNAQLGTDKLFIHIEKTKIVQKWSKFYTLTIVRWLARSYFYIIRNSKSPVFYGSDYHFNCYRVDDENLLTHSI